MRNQRYLEPYIDKDLEKKMVFLDGPRQVGKTTLALNLLNQASKQHPAYYNWDILKQRTLIKNLEFAQQEKLIILDEVHKYKRWRTLVKGFYDQHYPQKKLIVTGSARLDYYRKGGDSLHGRYHYYRLHPLTLGELTTKASKSDLAQLLKFGGFPEPFFSGTELNWRRWSLERTTRVLYEDLRDLHRVQEISLIELLIDALPQRVGSPLSVKSLAEDLEVAPQTVESWIQMLENLYYCFRILPYGPPKVRAVKKERKLYFWDWSMSPAGGPRFENLVASHLLKYCHFIQDTQGYQMELRFLRDFDKRECDFVVIKDKKPVFAVECKTGEKTVSPYLKYFRERSNLSLIYQVHLGAKDYGSAEKNVRVLPFSTFVNELKLP
ncbi:ATP-binding protein [bacterium]|nr:ATP-binding protein [bacterium]